MTEKQDQIRIAENKMSVEAFSQTLRILCRATSQVQILQAQRENRVKQPMLPGCLSVLMTMIKLSLELQIIIE